MTSEIRIILNPDNGNVESVQLLAPNKESRLRLFKIFQVLEDEISRFSERAMRLVHVEKVLGELASPGRGDTRKTEPATDDAARVDMNA